MATALDVRQAEQLQLTVGGQIAALERAIVQTENALSVLLGQPPGDVARGRALDAFQAPPEIPAGVPASLLTRRPDIRQAEQQLIAANAEIGVARAELFPRISLTGVLGVESRSLTDLLTAAPGCSPPPAVSPRRSSTPAGCAPACGWPSRCSASWSSTTSGRSTKRCATSRTRSPATARPPSSATAQQTLVASLRDAVRLSMQRYQGGLDSYLPVLDSQRNLFQSELGLVALQQQELGIDRRALPRAGRRLDTRRRSGLDSNRRSTRRWRTA